MADERIDLDAASLHQLNGTGEHHRTRIDIIVAANQPLALDLAGIQWQRHTVIKTNKEMSSGIGQTAVPSISSIESKTY